MSIINNIIKKIEAGINTFVSICINANRDLPFHDYNKADLTSKGQYIVGSNQINGTGDQKKYFISKSTLIYAPQDSYIKFNSMNNVWIYIFADTWYEFKSNIHTIFWDYSEVEEASMVMYFEGVMYNEARRPE